MFLILSLIAGWWFLNQENQTTDPRSQAATNQSYQLLIEESLPTPTTQVFDVYVSAFSQEAVITAVSARITVLPAGAVATPQPTPTPQIVPEAKPGVESLKETVQSFLNSFTAHAQTVPSRATPSPAATTAPIAPVTIVATLPRTTLALTSNVTRDPSKSNRWNIALDAKVQKQNGQINTQVFSAGKVKIATIAVRRSAADLYQARFTKQSIQGYFVSSPGTIVELTRTNETGFSCPVVVIDRCSRGYEVGTDQKSGCTTCVPQKARTFFGREIGKTTPLPGYGYACAQVYMPVCGVDGKTYGNSCEASVASVAVASQGECQ